MSDENPDIDKMVAAAQQHHVENVELKRELISAIYELGKKIDDWISVYRKVKETERLSRPPFPQ